MQVSRYHPSLVILHWVMAALLLLALGMGTFSLTAIPNASPEKLFALRGHMVVGMLILVLMLARLVVRLSTARPPAASTGHRVLDRLAVLAHYAFYVLVFLMAGSGFAVALQAGLPGIVFGGSGAPLPESFTIFRPRIAHGVIARLLMALIVLHVVAALYHHFVRRDSLLSRMWFGRR
jgi:cytochrome b561